MRHLLVAGLTVVSLVGMALPVRAQGALAGGAISALVNEGETSVAFSGSVSYRVNRALGFGVEVMHASDIDGFPQFQVLPAALRPMFDDFDSRITTFTTNVRLEVPTTTTRLIPFVVGGGGVASVSREYPIYYSLASLDGLTGRPSFIDVTGLTGLTNLPAGIFAPNIYPQGDYEDVSTSMVLTLGGGVSILATDHLSIDVDLRMFRLFEQGGSRSIGRFGAGVGYRF